jgi:hypothetical protein
MDRKSNLDWRQHVQLIGSNEPHMGTHRVLQQLMDRKSNVRGQRERQDCRPRPQLLQLNLRAVAKLLPAEST